MQEDERFVKVVLCIEEMEDASEEQVMSTYRYESPEEEIPCFFHLKRALSIVLCNRPRFQKNGTCKEKVTVVS